MPQICCILRILHRSLNLNSRISKLAQEEMFIGIFFLLECINNQYIWLSRLGVCNLRQRSHEATFAQKSALQLNFDFILFDFTPPVGLSG